MESDRPGAGRGDSIDDLSVLAIIKRKLLRKRGSSSANSRRRLIIIASSLGLALGIATAIGWKLFLYQPANVNPFSAKLTASLQFPLFHPTYVPSGYHVDVSSVTEPTTGVVVFSLDGSNKQKIYISEEARPSKYDIGGFFAKFSGLKESAIPGGTLASGKIDSGQTEISSMLNNQVWIICNTNASVPMDQMAQLAKNLSSNVAQ
jgi:hypothetical protein